LAASACHSATSLSVRNSFPSNSVGRSKGVTVAFVKIPEGLDLPTLSSAAHRLWQVGACAISVANDNNKTAVSNNRRRRQLWKTLFDRGKLTSSPKYFRSDYTILPLSRRFEEPIVRVIVSLDRLFDRIRGRFSFTP